MLEKRTYGSAADDHNTEAELIRYIYSNHLQSASLELDHNGNIISYEEYHPYGTTSYQATNASINAVAKRYRYTGKERDEESGLYYYGARYYMPWLGRWTAVDPINSENYNLQKGYGLEKNRKRDFLGLCASPYEYAYDNPINYYDPTGEQPNGVQPNGVHRVIINSGDTFSGIAKQYNITQSELKKVNPQIKDIDKINAGEYINLPVNKELASISKDNQKITQLNQKLLDLQKFEQYPDYGPSTGWSLRNLNHVEEFEVTNASSGYEVGRASMGNYDIVNFIGDLLEAVKVDPGMVKFENEIVNRIKSDPRFGKEEFYDFGIKVVGFGGTRWSSPEEAWSSVSRKNPLLHKSTWMVAADQLTWLLRNATVKYFAEVDGDGIINIQYRLHDQLDLSPQKGRQEAYNNISKVLGFGYHTLGGGNKNMQTRATWESKR